MTEPQKVAITWRPVTSSNVASIGWPQIRGGQTLQWGSHLDDATLNANALLVLFKDGTCYAYVGCSKQRAVYMATRCPSVGSYLSRVVKPLYRAVRIPELDVNGPPF